MSEHWRSSYDDWKTTDDRDPGRSDGNGDWFKCLHCLWKGRGYAARSDHWYATHHHIVWRDDPRQAGSLKGPSVSEQTLTGDGQGRR